MPKYFNNLQSIDNAILQTLNTHSIPLSEVDTVLIKIITKSGQVLKTVVEVEE